MTFMHTTKNLERRKKLGGALKIILNSKFGSF